ncbi:MAG: DNA gyrase subunit A [Elusimicrobia bacterium CG08_land_8_20_14_0_20_44_26]|nr:MAG: DNA gyrase subunit A [Elusimicrobia bacterium CG08_land_8_20_14_0_20_44_26]
MTVKKKGTGKEETVGTQLQDVSKIIIKNVRDEMTTSYVDYSMSVIVGRALPDVRDGLKPVHRRILFSMKELALAFNKPYKKAARIVGECLGKYHPHGDLAVYDALIRMAQDFSLRYPLVQCQGNVGSVDGDPPAAMRYVEARLAKISDEMLKDIDKETVDFRDNFDGTLKEPSVMPSSIPNLLVNGSSGIAVGMATNIPSHNLGEIVDALIALIDNPEMEDKELFRIVPAPDFPTGGIITNRGGIYDVYKTGRGSFKIKARTEIEELKGNREAIVVTELPYQVNKANLIENIADLVREKHITGITNIRDESDKDGMRIVIDVSRDAPSGVVLNQLLKHTQLSTNFGVIMLSLVNNVPRVLNLREMLGYYIDHRVEVVTRMTEYDKRKAEARSHILEGLKIALENLDKIISLIKKSKTPDEARQALVKSYGMTEIQAQAILDMKLQQLTGLERLKVEEEYIEKIKLIEKLKNILSDTRFVLEIIKKDLLEIKEKYADKRRTEISDEETVLDDEDLIDDADVVLTITHQGYIKRVPLSTWRVQGRGGKGVMSMTTKDEDYLENLFVTTNLATFLIFTNLGRVYWLKVWKIPEAGRISRGKAIVNFLTFKTSGEKFNSFFQIRNLTEACGNLLMVSERGIIKKSAVADYSNPRSSGIIAINLDDGDKLVKVLQSLGNDDVVLATRMGKAIRFSSSNLRVLGRSARGVRGIKLAPSDSVVGMAIQNPSSKESLLVISEKGYGKRTDISAYRKQTRGGKGVINMKINEKTGPVVALIACGDKDEIMIITTSGITIRQNVKNIRKIGRATSGVRLIKLNEGDKVASVGKVISEEVIPEGAND